MKKILYLLLCVILITGSFTACSDTDQNITEESTTQIEIEINEINKINEAYDLYTKMLAVMADVKSIDMEISALIDTFTDSEEYSGLSTGNIKKAVNIETGGNDYAINFTMSLNDAVLSVMTAYYTDGISYLETAEMKQCFKESSEKLAFLPNSDLLEFPENAVKEFTVSEHNGGKKVEMILYGDSVTSIIEKNKDEESYILKDVVCEFIVDKNNMLEFHRLIYEESIIFEYEDNIDRMKINRDISVTVNSYNDVKVELPSDLDEYIYMDFGS